jgi:uncharacterized protein (TIGR02186 family)
VKTLVLRHAAALALLVGTSTPASAGSPRAAIQVEPGQVDVNLFFNGATVKVSGTVPGGRQVVVVCRGKGQKLELKKKGKVWGVLWMNTSELSYDDLPALYLASSSAPLTKLASPETLRRLGVGYNALAARATPGAPRDNFSELTKLKHEEGMFAQREGVVKLRPGPGGALQVEAECRIPARAPIGTYRAEIFGFKDGEGELLASGSFGLKKVGLARFITSLAETRGLLYGIFAVGVAIVMGLLTGLVFGLKGKAH